MKFSIKCTLFLIYVGVRIDVTALLGTTGGVIWRAVDPRHRRECRSTRGRSLCVLVARLPFLEYANGYPGCVAMTGFQACMSCSGVSTFFLVAHHIVGSLDSRKNWGGHEPYQPCTRTNDSSRQVPPSGLGVHDAITHCRCTSDAHDLTLCTSPTRRTERLTYHRRPYMNVFLGC